MFNLIFKMNVQGRKHPGRCASAESELLHCMQTSFANGICSLLIVFWDAVFLFCVLIIQFTFYVVVKRCINVTCYTYFAVSDSITVVFENQ